MNQIIYVSSPESQQIHSWNMDEEGRLTLLQVVDTPGKGQPMAIHPANTHLYVGVKPVCAVITYRIDYKGLLTKVGMVSLSESSSYLTTDLLGKTLYSASYSGCCLNVIPINAQGIVCTPNQTVRDLNHCHSVNVDRTNALLWVPCLTEDRIRLYAISKFGHLTPHTLVALESVIGSGPRHMAFHHNGCYAYVVNEFSGTIDVIAINVSGISPRIVQTLDIMPEGFSKSRWAADIHITPDGRWLYCCERIASVISCFSVSGDGSVLNLLNIQITEAQPRGFNIDVQGKFLVTAGQKSHHIAVYAIHEHSGVLIPLERYAVGQGPIWVSILSL
ncbi:6-phosphogluconolactonase [Candidatus Steffania adelgidicola]|uniref:6-phosphogluconolactonase n=1 Tax=Candidatus Steffania adelgidicola TaxID=1076626 RepID=UPI001D01274E|nr:6-phosphogluconolactonase [Candidatus Steffania adelgidicola]UDG79978.1 6-phosphogluconolactonase [Candidatus Steffania adelgidicola]